MIHGPDLTAMRERAKTSLMHHLVRLAENMDSVPPTMRAKYVQKLSEATAFKQTGIAADLLQNEANLRGVTVDEQADLIISMSAPSDELELVRMRLNMAIDAATDTNGIVLVLAQAGLEFKLDLTPGPL